MAGRLSAASDLGGAQRVIPLTQEDRDWERVAPRQISKAQWRQLEHHAAEIFQVMGMRLDSPATRGTPRRFIRALFDATDGYEGDSKLVTAFPTECDGGPDCRISQIVQGPIAFHSICEHHALPFFGQAWVGYIAHDRIIPFLLVPACFTWGPDHAQSGRHPRWP